MATPETPARVTPRPRDHVNDAFYARAEARTAALRQTVRHELGVAYGEHPRQVLDLYYPAASATGAAVVVYLHGGGFQFGEPGRNGYLGQPYLERGAIFASVGYRLMPDLTFPDTAEDVERALAWLYRGIGARGGDPNRLYLVGHSTGAMLAADVALRTDWTRRLGLPADVLRGVVPVSGLYDFRTLPAHMVNKSSRRWVGSRLAHIDHLPPRTILAAGSQEHMPEVITQTRQLADRLRERGASVELFILEGRDHLGAANCLAEADHPLSLAIQRLTAAEPTSGV